MQLNRRAFLETAGSAMVVAGVSALAGGCGRSPSTARADYTPRIGRGSVEAAPGRVVSTILYNGQFPGPLLRLIEGKPVVVDVFNDTGTAEQLHWHGQTVPVGVDGSAEKARHLFPRTGCGGCRSHRARRDCGSTTPIWSRVWT